MQGFTLNYFVIVISNAFFLEYAVAIGFQQLAQVVDLFAKLFAFVGVGYEHTVGRHFDNLGG